jgi:hypothetical protein
MPSLLSFPMFKKLESKHLEYKNYKKGNINRTETEINEITCPLSFTEDKFIVIKTKKNKIE